MNGTNERKYMQIHEGYNAKHTKRTACNAKRNVKNYKNIKNNQRWARGIHNNISPGRKSVGGGGELGGRIGSYSE